MRRMAAVALPPIIPHMIAAASKLYEPKGSAGVPTPVCDCSCRRVHPYIPDTQSSNRGVSARSKFLVLPVPVEIARYAD